MGTYTYHTLTVVIEECDKHKYSEKEIIAQLRSEYEEASYALDEEGETEDEAKWYDSHEDLTEFSKKYPSVLFKLTQSPADGDDEDFELEEFEFHYKNGEELSVEDGGIIKSGTSNNKPDFTEKLQPKKNMSQDISPAPSKTDWEIWMEKSIAARNQR